MSGSHTITANIIDLYELSPMQQGMLFHEVVTTAESKAPESLYFEQRHCVIVGDLQVSAFQQAWQQAIDRHAIFRTGFYWKESEKPLQVVYDQAALPWQLLDWQAEPELIQNAQLEEFLVTDRQTRFDLQKPPLMRCSLIRLAVDRWQFIWSHHHILMDGWCNGILLRQVLADYETLRQRKSAIEPNILNDGAYRDYILWLQQQSVEKSKVYWQSIFQGFILQEKWLQDWQYHPVAVTETRSSQSLKLLPQVSQNLQQFVQQNRLTIGTVFQGVWALLISNYSDSSDIVFGLTVSGRPATLENIDRTLGLFINTLPVRVQLKSQQRVTEWLQTIQTEQVARSDYSYSNLAEIQSWIGCAGQQSIFDSLLVIENYPMTMNELLTSLGSDLQNHLQITEPQSFSITNYPLVVSILPGDAIDLHVDYQCDRFSNRFIQHLLSDIQHILESLLQAITLDQIVLKNSIPTLNSMGAGLIELDNTGSPIAAFEQLVQQQPEHLAIVGKTESLSYAELNGRANQLAHYLLDQGIQPNDRIAFQIPRSPQQIIAILGILKAGAAYIPIDMDLPAARVQYLLADSQPRLVLEINDVEQHAHTINQCQNPIVPAQSNSLAYVIYTSGSTGLPKGVMISRQALYDFTTAAIETYGIQQSDRVLQFASISFDAAIEEIFTTLSIGATLVLRSVELPTVDQFWKQCRDRQISILDLPTAYWGQLVENTSTHQVPTTLRSIIIGGELPHRSSIEAWNVLGVKIALWNSYGPTETTVVATVALLTEARTIGRPLPGRNIYILDRWMRPTSDGMVGEIYIGGWGLATGYWNRPELTQERFLVLDNGERVYRTGDRGFWQANGQISYQGRRDDQVKLRGFRVELAEVAAVIEAQVQVDRAVVALDEQSGQAELIAYYIGSADPETLRSSLSAQLPHYMVPADFIALSSFPITPLGKLDRRALQQSNTKQSSITSAIQLGLPRSPIEEILVDLWRDILSRSPISIHDRFFDIGGQSLLAMRLIARIQQSFSIEVSFQQLFETGTIADLAPIITSRLNSQAATTLIRPIDRSQPLRLSFAQERLWVLQQLEPESTAYHVLVALQLTGKLDLIALHKSFAQILDRHELMRAHIYSHDGIPCLSIRDTVDLPSDRMIDLSHLSKAQQRDEILARSIAQVKAPFSLEYELLWRLQILKLSDNQHILLLTLHHLITDGWSILVLAKEWSSLYYAQQSQKDIQLPTLSIQYADYAAAQRVQESNWQSSIDYWKQQLQNIPLFLALPIDRTTEPLTQSFKTGARSQSFAIPDRTTAALQEIGRDQNATLFMTLLATFGVLLHRLSHTTENPGSLIIGTPIANRQSAQLESLMGLFANLLPLRLDFPDEITFEGLLNQVKQTVLQAYAHQEVPFDRIVDALDIDRDNNHDPIVQVAFLLDTDRPVLGSQDDDDRLLWNALEIETGTAKFDLTLMLKQTEVGIEGQWEYRSKLFNAETFSAWSELFLLLLESIVSQPDQSIAHYSIVPEPDRCQLTEWNQTEQPYDLDGIIPAFQHQVALFPDSIALQSEQQQISYSDLDRQSNHIAHCLQQAGVQPGDLVALRFGRSIAAILTMLAVLKVGAVYLPIDLQMPETRLMTILQDSQTQWIINAKENVWIAPKELNLRSIDWSDLRTHIEEEISIFVSTVRSLDDLVYVMYTSGSTGAPKGVAIAQRGILRLVQSCQFAQLDSNQRILQAASLAFDAATFEIWGALLNGGRLVILPDTTSEGMSLEHLLETIRRQQVTTLWLTAGLLHVVIEELDRRQDFSPLRSVQQLLAGGDVLSSTHLRSLQTALPQLQIINGYGPTENTTFTCCRRITPEDLDQQSPPIGTPIQNTQVYVLDRNQQLLPIGIPGELYVAGAGLAMGYWQQPELTQTCFIHGQERRLYATGDRVQWSRSGVLQYLGRLDHQVKIRGFRVELSEIAATIQKHPAIAQAVVNLDRIHFAIPTLIAYYKLNSDYKRNDDTSNHLKNWISDRLPSYMQPAQWIQIDAVPLTINGKVDRNQLPVPDRKTGSQKSTQPTNPIEQQLIEVWESVLRQPEIDRDDNFFALGGDSILAMQMVSRAQSLGLQIIPAQLFHYQTIAQLAPMLTIRSATIDRPTVGPVPLTPIQHWFFQQPLPNPNHFNQSVILELTEPLDLERLQHALLVLINHHDLLRSRFTQVEKVWHQEIQPLYSLEQIQCVEIPDRDLFVSHANALQASLSLTDGKLFQVAYSRLPESPDRLLIIIHHLVIDGLSWRIFLGDLQLLYQQQLTQVLTFSLPPRQPYKTWSEQLLNQARSPEILQSLTHWLTQTSFSATLPDYHPEQSNTIADSITQTFKLSIYETEQLLRQVHTAYNTQIQEILITAIAQGISSWSSCNRVRLDLETHGRDEQNFFRSVGWFTNIFPVQFDLTRLEIREDILQIKETLRSIPQSGQSYGILRYLAEPAIQKMLQDQPKSLICFNYLGQVESDPNSGFSLVESQNLHPTDLAAPRSYAIDITAAVRSQQLEVAFTYSPNQIATETLNKLIHHCKTALQSILEHCIQVTDTNYSPSDFGLVNLIQSDLDAILAMVEFEAGGVS